MISVFLGTQDKQYKRLIDYIVKAKEDRVFGDEKILIQYGQTKYDIDNVDKNLNIEFFDFKQEDEVLQIIKESRYVISHSGVGLLMSAIKEKKKVIIVPRLKKYKEHINDHQIQIAENFKNDRYGLVAEEYDEFIDAIKKIEDFKQNEYKSNNENFCNKLNNLVLDLIKK